MKNSDTNIRPVIKLEGESNFDCYLRIIKPDSFFSKLINHKTFSVKEYDFFMVHPDFIMSCGDAVMTDDNRPIIS